MFYGNKSFGMETWVFLAGNFHSLFPNSITYMACGDARE